MNFYVRRYGRYSRHARGPKADSGRLSLFWRAVIVFYFIACAAVIGARWFFTSNLDAYRGEIASLASRFAGVEISIEEIDGGFRLIHPVVVLKNVSFSRPGGPVSLTLPKIEAELSWSSLWHLEPRFRTLIVSDPDLTVRRLKDGSFDVAGFVLKKPAQAEAAEEKAEADEDRDSPAEQPFTAWLLAQDRLALRNGAFTFIDEQKAKPEPVVIRSAQAVFEQGLLGWRAGASGAVVERRGAGAAAALETRRFELKAEIARSLFAEADNPLTWRGELYAHFDSIDIARMLRGFGVRGYVHSGEGAARFWASVDAGRVTSVTADLALRRASVSLGKRLEPLTLPQLRGRLLFSEKEDRRWSAQALSLEFEGPKGAKFGPADLAAECTRDAAGRILGCRFGASEISIGTLMRLSPALPMPAEGREFLAKQPLSGTLRNVRTGFDGDVADAKSWLLNMDFSGLTLPADESAGAPGFRNLSGSVASAAPGEFDVTLESAVAMLNFPGVFREPRMHFDSLSGRVHVRTSPELSLAFENFRAKNADALVTASGTWRATGGAGTVDASGTAENVRGASVVKYLPKVCGDPALDYVEAAVISGRGSNGRFILRGDLNRYPWDGPDKGTGLFRIEADVTDGVLDFLPSHRFAGKNKFVQEEHWPKLTNISAHLLFEGNRMLITGRSAKSMNLTASDVTVEIPDFTADDVLLKVKGRTAGDLGDALRYLRTGKMMRTFIGSAFDEAEGRGPARAALDLTVPLTGGKPVTFRVDASLSGADFRYLPVLPELKGTAGALRITQDGIFTDKPITGATAAGPATVVASTSKGLLTLAVSGHASPDDAKRLLEPLGAERAAERFSGSAGYRIRLQVPLAEPSRWSLSGESDLMGLASSLPQPFVKDADSAWPARFSWTPEPAKAQTQAPAQKQAAPDARRLEVELPGRVAVSLELAQNAAGNYEPRAGFIGIGRPMRHAAGGIDVDVDTPAIDLDAWQAALAQPAADAVGAAAGEASSGAPASSAASAAPAAPEARPAWLPVGAFFSALRTANLKTTSLIYNGSSFQAIDATLRHVRSTWHLRIQSDAASGQVEMAEPAPGAHPSLKVRLTRLHLPEAAASGLHVEDIQNAPSSQLPNFDVVIDDFRYGGKTIGKIELQAASARAADGRESWTISSFAVRSASGTLTGSGGWLASAADASAPGTTTMKLSADLKSLGGALHSLGIRDVVRDAPGSLSADLSWSGLPQRFNLATLNGKISARLRSGQLVQVEPGAGRILSLLSLQHLLRRLTLDFRDVAGRGLTFDSITADAEFRNGILRTEKSTLIGSAATVLIGGDTDFVNEVLDLKALVLPSINAEGASIALAVANPAIGIGTLVAQWLLKDRISEMLSMEYEIRGSFDDPKVERIGLFGGAAREEGREAAGAEGAGGGAR